MWLMVPLCRDLVAIGRVGWLINRLDRLLPGRDTFICGIFLFLPFALGSDAAPVGLRLGMQSDPGLGGMPANQNSAEIEVVPIGAPFLHLSVSHIIHNSCC